MDTIEELSQDIKEDLLGSPTSFVVNLDEKGFVIFTEEYLAFSKSSLRQFIKSYLKCEFKVNKRQRKIMYNKVKHLVDKYSVKNGSIKPDELKNRIFIDKNGFIEELEIRLGVV